ncbi:MAG: class I SAM-dependent methyltransferase [Acidobacteriota bacterium]|nr:class I SAM-dependent methyltransferase [Acidobacteriota bacterium]MDP2391276.1 class I SAM-dependent methyltransferase [Acidobacteriota bacterium]
MGAATHLGIKLNEYDAVIRTLIPHYQELIAAAATAVGALARTAPAVVDLGTGSGALAQAILKARPRARLIGIDEDPGMLAMAEKRLRGRIQAIEGDFEYTVIPRCDVISASFALHHIPTGRRKAAIYKRCFAALRPGGMLVSADCCLAASKVLQQTHHAEWLAHLQTRYPRAKAEGYLRAWAKQDVYFTLEREVALLQDAGFSVEIAFRKSCFAVVVGLK